MFRATDLETGALRAVKVMSPDSTAVAQQRFITEGEAMRRIRHPCIVAAHAVGTYSGVPYLVMDLIQGESLLERRQAQGPLGPDEVGLLMIQVLSALAEAHTHGMIHRDVKPANILVDGAGRAFLCDFGIARLDGGARLTETGSTLGTILYMAPEHRYDAHHVDLTADLYAVGATVFRLSSDEPPVDLFAASPDSRRWAAIPPSLRRVVVRATRTEPRDRYPDARSMAEALEAEISEDARRVSRSLPACEPSGFRAPHDGIRPK